MTDHSNDDSDKNRPTTCKVAVVGAGYMAREHIRAFQDLPGVEVVGIHSRTPERARTLAQEFRVPAVYESIADMHEQTQADLVVVTVPELQVNDVCCACFEHPWAALIEKPAGYDVTDAEAIEAVARRKDRRAYVALNRRHYGSTRALVADLATLPGPRLIKVQDQEDPAAALRAGQPKLVVDNWHYANSIHVIDFFLLLGRGRITNIDPIIRWDPQQPRYVAARITYDSGDIGLYEAIWQGPGPWAVSVNTPDKRWARRPVEGGACPRAGSGVLDGVHGTPADTAFKPGLRVQAALAVAAALGQSNELPTVTEALASMRLAQAIYA